MKKDVIDLIYNICLPFFEKIDFKIKKNNQGGVIFNFKHKDFVISSGISFFDAYKGIEFISSTNFIVRFFDIENIYNTVFSNTKIELPNTSRTFSVSDTEWQNIVTDNGNKSPEIVLFENTSVIQELTMEVLKRVEQIVFSKIEQSLSIPYWASFYEEKKERIYLRGPGEFYSNINDDYSIKHLIILKLCGSPSFEEAFNIHYERVKGFWEKFPEDEGTNSQMAMIKNLKETLNTTPAKYDYRDITPPYRFIKKVDAKPVEPKPSASEVYLEDRAVKVEINAFEISTEQQAKIDSFLKDIKKHFEAIKEVIIDNAEFENEQGKLQNFEDCSYVIQDIAEAKGLLNGQKLGSERAAAQYLYLKEIAIDPDQNQVTGTVASDFSEIKLTALLDLSGHVEIVHS